jgi:DNA mismatch repair protein MutS2
MEQLEQERRRAWKAGDKVRLRSLNMQGVIISLGEEEAEVAIGALRIRSRLGDLERPAGSGAASSGVLTASQLAPRKRKLPPPDLPQETQERSIRLPQSPGMELDLRGMRADDALDKLDRYLDAAVYSGTPFVRIIHGKGTGKLRDAVREALRDHPSVKSFEGGADKEGGEGVTVAKF